MFVFLKEDSVHPEKQDVAIFVPADTNIRRYGGKLSEQLSKHHLKDHANIISKPHQTQSRTKNNIFLVSSASQLKDWDYDYSNLFYVIDYETETNFYYDYNIETYVYSISQSSGA